MNELNIGNFMKDKSNEDLVIKLEEPNLETTNDQVQEIVQPSEVVEQTQQVTNDTVDENQQSDSSLTPSNSEPTQEEKKLKITDDLAFNYLSEKLGKDIKSYDDLKIENENPLESDPYLKSLYEWRKKTNRPLEDWIKYQKDYSQLSDMDVAKEFLQYEYPELTEKEISLELRKYQSTEDDFEDESALKTLELKKLATKGRKVLQELNTQLEQPNTANLTPELKQDLEIAREYKTLLQQQEQSQKQYSQAINKESLSTDSFELNLSDDLKISYKLSEQNKKELPQLIDTMPHWKNQDGSWNYKAVINDAIKISHFDKMVKLAYEQGLSAGKESIISEAKNTTLSQPLPNGANAQDGRKGIEIEGFDEFLGQKGMKIRF